VEYASSRYVLDAVLTATVGQPPDRIIVLTDLDCVWVRAERVFAAIPQTPSVGCIFIVYPLSLRRTARDFKLRRTGKVRHDLTDPARMARRFNVAGTGLTRRLRDDGWLARQRLYAIARQRFASLARRLAVRAA
jgi:hypothetical protein